MTLHPSLRTGRIPIDESGELHDHDDFGGFHRDRRVVERRRALQWMGGLGLAGLLAACGGGGDGTPAAGSTSTTGAGGSSSTTTTAAGAASADTSTSTTAASTIEASAGEEIPEETAGPYPSDGSNGPNSLADSAVVRSDITSSFGDFSGTAEGVPATIALTVVDAATGAALVGHAVYLWHCTADGAYSIYEIEDQNYLRGVNVTDDAGRVSFTTIFPGCYNGRWPHAHFEVFESVDDATSGSQAMKTSQLAIPQADCEAVYADSRYGASADNLSRQSLSSDNIFADGWESQLATVTPSGDGSTISLLVRI